MFGGNPRAGLATMNLGKLEDGVSTKEQLLEVLGDNTEEEEDANEVVADNNDNSRLTITSSRSRA